MTRTLVVVPALNEAAHIRRVIEALHQDLPDGPAPLIVVADGGSTDGTPDIVRALMADYPRLRLLDNPLRLQGAAINLAVRRFGGDADALVRCDAHADYPRGFVRDVLARLARPGVGAVVVAMDSVGDAGMRKAVAWLSDSWLGSGGSAHRAGTRSGFVDHGHHAGFWLRHFRAAGGYDETFAHNEDAELDCRQRALGVQIHLDADIRLGYRPRATLAALARQYFGYGRGRSRTVQRHRSSLRLRQFLVPAATSCIVAALLLAPLAPWLLALPVAYLAALLVGAGALAKRHHSATAWLAAPAAATMHFAWASGFLLGLLTCREPAWRPGDPPRFDEAPQASKAPR
jgi:succinoglycan biosynthesis protein ExoA